MARILLLKITSNLQLHLDQLKIFRKKTLKNKFKNLKQLSF